MIRGLHGLLYSSDVERSRAFVRDKLKLPHTDVGGGWLIFDLPEGDLGFHPVEDAADAGSHDVSFYCDDIKGTVADLRARGVEFTGEPQDHGYGWVTYFTIPGGIKGADQVLVTAEPAGGSLQPTTQPVIVANTA